MDPRLQINLIAAIVPVVLGLLWFAPVLLGRLWPLLGVEIPHKTPLHIVLMLVVVYIAGFYVARSMGSVVIHQHGLYSMLAGDPDMKDPNSALSKTVEGLMDKYGHNYRTFKHGAFHGVFTGLYFILPVIITIGLFDKRKLAWMLVYGSYWTACLTLIGGIVCAYMP